MDLIRMERDIIRALQFDIQAVSPQVYIDRFLIVRNLSKIQSQVTALCENLIKQAMVSSDLWLEQKTSVVAASVMNLAMSRLTGTDRADWYDCHRIDPLLVK